MSSKFLVYEHWRPDKDVCFYVGKGRGRRVNDMLARNKYHKNIQAKLARLGMGVEVRMYRTGLTESEAFALEIERIAFWRSVGVKLANLTNGGEGPSGYKHSEKAKRKLSKNSRENNPFSGKKHTEEVKRRIGNANRGRKHTQEELRKISESSKLQIHSLDRRKKMSDRLRGNKNWLGKKHSPETIEKMRVARTAYWAAKRSEKENQS